MTRKALLVGTGTLALVGCLSAWAYLSGPAIAEQDPLPDPAEELRAQFESMSTVAIAVHFPTPGMVLESEYGTVFGDAQGNFAYVARDNGRSHTLVDGQILTHHKLWGEYEPVVREQHQWLVEPISDVWPALISGDLEWLDRRPGYYGYGDSGNGIMVELAMPYSWAEDSHIFLWFSTTELLDIRLYLPDGSDIVIAVRGIQWNQPLPAELFTGQAATTTWYPKLPGHNPRGGTPEREDRPEDPGPLMHLSEWRALQDTGGA